MTVCYNKLWKLLIDKNMKKKDLRLAAGISTTALAKLGKNEHVSTEMQSRRWNRSGIPKCFCHKCRC